MRFVHVADVHLDTAFAGRSDAVRKRLREASREAFRKAVDLAVREDAHAFLIAGDLFDGARLSFQTERFLLEQAARLDQAEITVVYATGNHDPGSPETGPRRLAWPANVHVAGDDTPRRILVQDRSGVEVGWVTTVGHASDGETRDLSRLLRPVGASAEVALLHTQVHSSFGAEEHDAYAPSDLSWLVRAGFDYWALGHVHVRQELSADPPVFYAGSLQGKTHTDTGPRGALLVDLSDRAGPSVSFRSLAPIRWETIRVDHLDVADSLDRIEHRVEAAWNAERAQDPGSPGTEWMVRVALEGPCPLWKLLRNDEDRDVLANELTQILGALDVTVLADAVHPVLPIDEHRARRDVMGATLRLAQAVRSGEVRLEGLDRSSLAGIDSEDPSAVAAYVNALLEGADAELAARLLGGEADTP